MAVEIDLRGHSKQTLRLEVRLSGTPSALLCTLTVLLSRFGFCCVFFIALLLSEIQQIPGKHTVFMLFMYRSRAFGKKRSEEKEGAASRNGIKMLTTYKLSTDENLHGFVTRGCPINGM